MKLDSGKIFNFLTLLVIVLATVLVVQFSKGWRVNINDGTIVNTGILDVNSTPRGAEIYLNGELRGKTPEVINALVPGNYELELRLEGFTKWQKNVVIKGEQVSKLEAGLFEEDTKLEQVSELAISQLYFNPHGDNAIITSTSEDDSGIWRFQFNKSIFALERDKIKLLELNIEDKYDLSTADYQIIASPDFNKAVLQINEELVRYYIIDLREEVEPVDITEYLVPNSSLIWANNSSTIITVQNNSLLALDLNNLTLSTLSNWSTDVWAINGNKAYFYVENPFDEELSGLYISNLNGSERGLLDVNIDSVIQGIEFNSRYNILVISSDAGTFLYDLKTLETTKVLDESTKLFSKSVNERYFILSSSKNNGDLMTYDFEYSTTSAPFTIGGNVTKVYWSPNELKMFSIENVKGELKVVAYDPDGFNTIELLSVPLSSNDQISRILGFSSSSQDLYLSLFSDTIVEEEDAVESSDETPAEDEVINEVLYKLPLIQD